MFARESQMVRRKLQAQPYQPDQRPRLQIFQPPVGSWDAVMELLRRLDPMDLPETLSPTSLVGPEAQRQQTFDAMKFLCLLTPKNQPTGYLKLLASRHDSFPELWRKDLWYVVHRAYHELLWDLNPETASGEEIQPRLAVHCKSAKPMRAKPVASSSVCGAERAWSGARPESHPQTPSRQLLNWFALRRTHLSSS
jgi:hypothetical protein